MTICNCLYIQTPCHDDVTTDSVSQQKGVNSEGARSTQAIDNLSITSKTLHQNFGSKIKLSFTLYNSDDPIPENIHKVNLFNPRKGQIMFPGWFCQSRAAAWDDFPEKTI